MNGLVLCLLREGISGPARMLMGEFEQLNLLRLILENLGIYLQELQDELFDIFRVLVRVLCQPFAEH